MADAPKKPRRPIEEVRAELMVSPETQELAKTLGLSLEDYVEKVLSYYKDPSKEPMVYVASEEQIRAAGVEPPTEKAIVDYLTKVNKGEIDLRPEHMRDQFETGRPGPSAPKSALKDQVQRQADKDKISKG